MALPSSGQISLSEVNTELGNASNATISMGDAAVRTLFGVPSGAITMNAGHGKANEFTLTISSDASDINVATAATAAGWNGSTKLNVVVNSGIYVSATSTGNAAMTISGSFPGGLFIENNGYIVGKGGAGGRGTSMGAYVVSAYPQAGGAGGLALSASSSVSITNNGTIAGGGGGGGGGAGICTFYGNDVNVAGGGGGGGQGGKSYSSGGTGGTASGVYYNGPGGAGASGTESSYGAGGSRGQVFHLYGGTGGNGGAWGTAGSTGGPRVVTSPVQAAAGAAGGGSAGGAVSGNSNITWVSTGTRIGSIA